MPWLIFWQWVSGSHMSKKITKSKLSRKKKQCNRAGLKEAHSYYMKYHETFKPLTGSLL